MNKTERDDNSLGREFEKARVMARDTYMTLSRIKSSAEGLDLEALVLGELGYDIDLISETSSLLPSQDSKVYSVNTSWGNLVFDTERNLASSPLLPDQSIHIRPREALVLEMLMQHPERIHSAYALGSLGRVSYREYKNTPDLVARMRIARLRRVLGHTENKPLIHTVRSIGYTLTPNSPHFLNGTSPSKT